MVLRVECDTLVGVFVAYTHYRMWMEILECVLGNQRTYKFSIFLFCFPLLLLLLLPDVLNTKIKKQLNENVKYMFSIFPNYLPDNWRLKVARSE